MKFCHRSKTSSICLTVLYNSPENQTKFEIFGRPLVILVVHTLTKLDEPYKAIPAILLLAAGSDRCLTGRGRGYWLMPQRNVTVQYRKNFTF